MNDILIAVGYIAVVAFLLIDRMLLRYSMDAARREINRLKTDMVILQQKMEALVTEKRKRDQSVSLDDLYQPSPKDDGEVIVEALKDYETLRKG